MRSGKPIDFKKAVLDTYAINEAANQALLKHIDAQVWRVPLPEGSGSKTIASIFAHLHNVRLMWLKMTGKRSGLPAQLDRHRCTKKQVAAALARSAKVLSEHIGKALERKDGRISGFPPNAVAFMCYLLAHDAHHRGQIFMVSRQLGYRLAGAAAYGVWQWNKLLAVSQRNGSSKRSTRD
jgi:uncharacterized damage-inducible protein DinB